MFNKAIQQHLIRLDLPSRAAYSPCKVIYFIIASICKWIGFQKRPEVFYRIKPGAIGRQKFDMQGLRCSRRQSLNTARSMSAKPVPYNNYGLAYLMAQLMQKLADQRRVDRLKRVQTKIQVFISALRRNAYSGNRTDFRVHLTSVFQNGSLPSRRPCAPHERRHQKSTFIDKNNSRVQFPGFFLILVHSFLIHCWTASLSCSTAWRWGFWGLHPKLCRSRPI